MVTISDPACGDPAGRAGKLYPHVFCSTAKKVLPNSYQLHSRIAMKIFWLCLVLLIGLRAQEHSIAATTSSEAPKAETRIETPAIEIAQKISSYTESVGVTAESVPPLAQSIIPTQDPYPETEVAPLLRRTYQITGFSWGTQAAHAKLATLSFPQLLWGIPFINSKLSFYNYFRAGVRLTFRFNCTKFEYGTLMLAWLPYYQTSGAPSICNRMNDWTSLAHHLFPASFCNPTLISAQEGKTVSVEIPWCSPKPYMDVSSTYSELGELNVFVLHPLQSVSPNPPTGIQIAVYAEFLEPQVVGYTPDTTPATMAQFELAKKNGHFASRVSARIARQKQEQEGKRKAFDVIVERLRGLPKPAETQSFISSLASGVKKEGQAKTSAGLISGIAEAVSSIAPRIAPMIGAIDPGLGAVAQGAGSAADMLAPVFKSMGLSKPTSMGTTSFVAARFDTGMAHGSGLDPVEKLSLDPESGISTTGAIVGNPTGQPSLQSILCKPSLFYVGSWSAATRTVGQLIFGTYVGPAAPGGNVTVAGHSYNMFWPSYAAYYSQLYRYWRGGSKYVIRFTTSSFVTCRVRICHVLPDQLPLATLPTDISGDMITKVVDISGDTTVEFRIPYLAANYYTSTATTNDSSAFYTAELGNLCIYLETPIASVDTSANPLIYFSVWYAAAEDFQLHGYAGNPIEGVESYGPPAIDGKLRNPKPKIAETQCDMIKLFNQPFEGLAPAKYMPEQGVIRGEQVNSLLSMLHRYHWFSDFTAGLSTMPVLPELHNFVDTPFYLIAPFLFMRGGMRYMQQAAGWTEWIAPDPNNRYYDWYTNNQNVGSIQNSGVSFGGDSTSQPFRAEIPFYDYRAFLEIFPTIDTERVDSMNFTQTATTGILLRCMADDFSVGVLSTPPPMFYFVS
jgi:hypothetical protein